jgi:glycosyltransferase involved in cell wall biosynthesis
MKRRICIVGTDNYPVLNHELDDKYFGGEAVQQTILARAFRDFGYEVTMICLDYGQPQDEEREKIRVIKTYRENAGIPVIRFLYPRMSSVISALWRASADIYFQSCAGAITGAVAWFCKRHSRTFVFRIASDSDCEPGSQIIRFYRDRKLFEYGLRNADLISAQSHSQQSLLTKNYSLKSEVVNMACDIPSPIHTNYRDNDVLWVSNIRQCKRPDKLVQLARMLPDRKFTMIGGKMNGEEDLFRKTQQDAAQLANLEFLGPVRYHNIAQHFARSKVFVNTSDIEGFPNTFLQAWSHKIPVVSFFDPDNIIKTKELGLSPVSLDSMKSDIVSLIENGDWRVDIGDAGYQFVTTNYSPHSVVTEYDHLFASLTKQYA